MNANIQKAIWDKEVVTIGGGQFSGAELQIMFRQLKLGQAIERACLDLPVGFEVIVSLEKDAGVVVMIDADGNEHDIDHTGDFSETIQHAITAARCMP